MDLSNQLLKLTQLEKKSLKVLFLAKKAPSDDQVVEPQKDADEGIVPIYNFELFRALSKLGITVSSSRTPDSLLDANADFNYVFSILNRAEYRNSEVFVSSLCEYLDLPYLGARPHVRSLAEDKHLSKTLAKSLGIRTPNWLLYREDSGSNEAPCFPGPYFIKPRFGAASEHITNKSIQEGGSEFREQIELLTSQGLDVIVEQYIPGDNVTVPIVNNTSPIVLPCIQDTSDAPGGILTYRKNRLLEPGMSRSVFREVEPVNKMRNVALVLLPHLSPIDYYRVDFRVHSKSREPYLLDINVCCNLGSHSNVAIPAKHVGIDFDALLEHIVSYSIRRQNFKPN